MVTMVRGGEIVGPFRENLESSTCCARRARWSILHKVLSHGEPPINEILARDKEFGWTSNFDGFHEKERSGDIPLFYIRKMKRGVGYIDRNASPRAIISLTVEGACS